MSEDSEWVIGPAPPRKACEYVPCQFCGKPTFFMNPELVCPTCWEPIFERFLDGWENGGRERFLREQQKERTT